MFPILLNIKYLYLDVYIIQDLLEEMRKLMIMKMEMETEMEMRKITRNIIAEWEE